MCRQCSAAGSSHLFNPISKTSPRDHCGLYRTALGMVLMSGVLIISRLPFPPDLIPPHQLSDTATNLTHPLLTSPGIFPSDLEHQLLDTATNLTHPLLATNLTHPPLSQKGTLDDIGIALLVPFCSSLLAILNRSNTIIICYLRYQLFMLPLCGTGHFLLSRTNVRTAQSWISTLVPI